jgi:hypothetical protein
VGGGGGCPFPFCIYVQSKRLSTRMEIRYCILCLGTMLQALSAKININRNTSTLTHHIKERFAKNLNLTSQCRKSLKGPKQEIFVARIFTQIRPVWLDDLKTRPKSSKSLWWGPYIYLFVGEIFI